MYSTNDTRGLRTIFPFFLGLMIVAFVGVAVYTFYPPPHETLAEQIDELRRQEQEIRTGAGPGQLSPESQTELQSLGRQRSELEENRDLLREQWGRTTSIILIVFATFVMFVSLVRAEQLPVVSNGLLLGGVFTMVYGVGWIIATDTSIIRFIVISGALAVTLVLGYFRFARQRAAPTVAHKEITETTSDLREIERRVQELEARISRAASLLRGE